MKRALLVLALAGCGEGGGGSAGPAEAPPCDPPPLVCPEGDTPVTTSDEHFSVTRCPSAQERYLQTSAAGDPMGWSVSDGAVGIQQAICWPNGLVADYSTSDGRGNVESACYAEDGAPTSCGDGFIEEVSSARHEAWGI